jgi:HK97 family phage portal protein
VAARRRLLPAVRAALGLQIKGMPERIRASSAAYLVPGIPYSSTWSVKRATDEAYAGNPLVYRAIEIICENAVERAMILRKGDPKTGEIIAKVGDDPTRLLFVLNVQANPWEIGRIFRHRLLAQYLLSSKGVYIEVILTKGGRIGVLNVVDPDLVSHVPSETDPIAGFEIRTPNAAVQSADYLPRFNPKQPVAHSMLWIRAPHPLIMWEGMSPVQAAGLSIDLDHYARIYNRRFLQNDGRPGGLLAVKGVTSRDQLELIQAQFTGGPESAGRTTVVQADSISYADTSGSPRDLMWGELSNATKEEISMVFGVPRSILTDSAGQTFDNTDADWAIFWEGRMKSLLGTFDGQLDILTGAYDDALYLRHDLSDVWVLGRHEREAADRAAADLDRGAITVDEYREIAGRKPIGVPATQVLWLPTNGRMAAAAAELAQQAAGTPFAGTPAAETEPDEIDAEAPEAIPAAASTTMRLLPAGRRQAGGGADTETLHREPPGDKEDKQGPPRTVGSGDGATAWR